MDGMRYLFALFATVLITFFIADTISFPASTGFAFLAILGLAILFEIEMVKDMILESRNDKEELE